MDNSDINEMLAFACMYKDLGHKSVRIDAEDAIEIIEQRNYLLEAVSKIVERCEIFIDDSSDMRTHSVEVIMGIAEDAIARARGIEE